MATGLRPGLGMKLQDIVASGAPAEKPKFFGEGGNGRLIAGAIGDVLLQQSGMRPIFAPAQQQKRQEERDVALWELQRHAGLQDYEARQRIEQKYAKPTAPYRFQDNAGNVWERGPDGQNVRIFTDAAPKYVVNDGVMNVVPNPYTQQPPLPFKAPPTIDENTWNTGKPVGGQASAPGSFRR